MFERLIPHRPGGKPAPQAFTRVDMAPLTLLVASVIAIFWRVLFTPAMFFYRDVFNYSYPHARFIHEICRQGHLPYWNPLLNFGEPVLANPNFLFFYPSTLLLILLPVDLAYTLHYIVHLALVAVGTYGLARRWGQSRAAAFVAGFVFAFSGPVLSLGNLYNHMAAAGWIPWAILLTDLALEGSSCRPWILLTLVFSLQLLASEPFTLIATYILCLVYAAYQSRGLRRPLNWVNLKIIALFSIVGLLMVALSAVQLLPSLTLLSNSRRGVEGLPFNETTSWSFHPLQLLEFVVPGFFGSAMDTPTLWTMVLSNRNMPYYVSVFVGFIPLFLALVGWVSGRDRRGHFAGLGAVTLLVLSFGRFTPFFALVYLLLPPLALVRFPVKLMIPMMTLIALLAGWGIDALLDTTTNWKERRNWIIWPLTIGMGVLSLLWLISLATPEFVEVPTKWVLLSTNHMFVRSPAGELTDDQVAWALRFLVKMLQLHLPGLVGFALGGFVLTQALERKVPWAPRAVPAVAVLGLAHMAWVNYSANPVVPKSFYGYRPPVLAHFDSHGKPYRLGCIFREAEAAQRLPDLKGYLNFDSLPEARDLPAMAQIPFRDRLILARATMLLDIEAVSNIDVERSFPTYLYDFWVFALKGLTDPTRTACLLGRTNVRYQVLPSRAVVTTQREIAAIFNGSPEPHYLYENVCETPRAFVAARASRVVDVREILNRMSDPRFDPTTEVFLSLDSPPVSGQDSPGSAGEVEIVHREPDSVTLRAKLVRPAYVVLLDRFDPNWHATLDGQELKILRANGLFRAVFCGAGQHEIVFTYRQRGLRTGAAVSLATLGLLAALYCWHRGKTEPSD